MENLKAGTDVLFVLLGAIMVLAMHSGFAFLEVGTVREKNQVNALVKILSDFAVSTVAYFFVGYLVAYGTGFLASATDLAQKSGFELVRFFFLLTFAAAVPAIISGGIAERASFNPQIIATLHTMGGWLALAAVLLLGPRSGRYTREGKMVAHPPSSIPFLALGAWVLTVGWFGFNVMSAQSIEKISGLVALNSLMAMAGGTIAALVVGRNDPGFVHNGPLAGLVAVCAGSDVMHPVGGLVTGAVAGALFVFMFPVTQQRMKIDDVLGVWPLHGLCGAWGGIAAALFGASAMGGLGGVSFMAQVMGTLLGIVIALMGGFIVYGILRATVGLRLDPEEEFRGADLSIHQIGATPERESGW